MGLLPMLIGFTLAPAHAFDARELAFHQTRTHAPFEVISAYRSPPTNEMLRTRSADSGVVQHSMHIQGQAIDVRLADVLLQQLRGFALHLQRGGVGFYPTSEFVHVDTGRVRFW
jgi:uncharacterized protein YcbK (DUF882 family)